jgi:MoaA/NifB/PqqE/SkfB family radical SAM enzyme
MGKRKYLYYDSEFKKTEDKNGSSYRSCCSKIYNWSFSKVTGSFLRWGFSPSSDPLSAPAPEILDIEISTVCHRGCSFCYKSNTASGKNMSLEQFQELFEKFDENLTQIAFGIGDIDGNPDLYKILEYTRSRGVIPNITISGSRMKDSDYNNLARLCGAISVSHYSDPECFYAVSRLIEAGCKQVNIHQLLAEETYNDCIKLISAVKDDTRLSGLSAVVFLWLKEKGDRNSFNQIRDRAKYKALVDACYNGDVSFGFDSCSANNFLSAIEDHPRFKWFSTLAEPCESSLFSFYINVDGIAYPCSFCEGIVKGLDLKQVEKFSDIWNDDNTQLFRDILLQNNRSCPVYDLSLD